VILPRKMPNGSAVVLCALAIACAGTMGIDHVLHGSDARCDPSAPSMTPGHFRVQNGLAFAEAGLEAASGNERKLAPGTPVPDFTLQSAVDGHEVRLSDFCRRKPLVLLFGSFGCDVFCRQLPRLNMLFQEYKRRAEFLFVYTSEAPHSDLLPSSPGPETREERVRRGLQHFGLTFPCFFAKDEDALLLAYRGVPQRLLLVDRQGKIALDAGRGLAKGWDFDELDAWLNKNSSAAPTASNALRAPAECTRFLGQ
jgi:hypothetical protein